MSKPRYATEWKNKNFKDLHLWIEDIKGGYEIPLCDPERKTPRLPMMRPEFAFGKVCSRCKSRIDKFKENFPTVHIATPVLQPKPVKKVAK